MDDKASRQRAQWHFLFFDHAILRTIWHNFAEVAPGVFRANHPSPKRLAYYVRNGISTIVNLRGPSDAPHYLLELDACRKLGLTLLDVPGLTARDAPSREALIGVLDALRSAPKPLLLHCKSGADRSSLAAAVYLLAECGATIDEARIQFSPKFIHFKWTKTGVLDKILDTFEAEHSKTGISFEDWLRSAYDGPKIQANFDASRR
ncbi:MAG: protein tyrosine phosphatase [Aliishimia sp.]